MQLYIIRSQKGPYLSKQLEWLDHCPPAQLYATPHKDVALNQLIELNTRDVELRATVIACERDERGHPRPEALTSAAS